MRLPAPLALAIALPACSGSGAVPSADLAGTTWAELCPDSDPERSYLRLDADGSFAYDYDSPDDVTTDGGDTWTVEGRTLVISWNDGYATTRYDLAGYGRGTLPGTSTKGCADRARLERVRS